MLSKTANVTFVPDSSVFTDQASAACVLKDFVNIAKTLDGTMIVITGNAKYQADKAAGALSSDASVYQSTDISFMRIEN